MAFLDPILNPLLQPILNSSPFLALVIVTLAVSLIISLANKYLTDQNEVKRLKDRQKELQKKAKELRSQPEEASKVQKEMMALQPQLMKSSLKPMLFTMIPLLLVFGWMLAHLSFEPVFPGETYSISATFAPGASGTATLLIPEGTTLLTEAEQEINKGQVLRESKKFFASLMRKKVEVTGTAWRVKSEAGEHLFTVTLNEEEQSKKVLITKEFKYLEPMTIFENSPIESMQVDHNKLRPLGQKATGEYRDILGWKPGWLGMYIILSLIFSLALRKVLKIH